MTDSQLIIIPLLEQFFVVLLDYCRGVFLNESLILFQWNKYKGQYGQNIRVHV